MFPVVSVNLHGGLVMEVKVVVVVSGGGGGDDCLCKGVNCNICYCALVKKVVVVVGVVEAVVLLLVVV